jgi:Transglutaminase-like superfamily
MKTRDGLLFLISLLELMRYDFLAKALGYQRIRRSLAHGPRRSSNSLPATRVCRLFNQALVFYPRQVMCLQRSVALARVLRSAGLHAQVVIGYRARPFLSHAWVEVNGSVVNDSSGYARHLLVLDRI